MSPQELVRRHQIIDTDAEGTAPLLDAASDGRVEDLERQVARLRGELSDARHELARVREDSNRALTALRRQLQPLYSAMQLMFGHLDDAGVSGEAPASTAAAAAPGAPADARVTAVWEAWKSRLPPACGKVIDALLIHGDLSNQQIKVAARLGSSTVTDSIYKLNKAGLITKNGGRVSLKTL